MNQPVVLTTRTLLAFLLAVAMLSGGVAVAAAQLSQPTSAGAQARAASEVSELKQVNHTLRDIYRSIGSQYDFSGSGLRHNTHEIAEKVEDMCRAIAESPSLC
jgi:hypothetical protein